VTLLPDGKEAKDNADLVAAAERLIRAHVRAAADARDGGRRI
jgi:uncharacterized protein (DUF849 family)